MRNSPPRRRGLRPLDLALMVLAALVLAWLLIPGIGPNLLGIGSSNSTTKTGQNSELQTALDQLPVINESPAPHYDRIRFGDGWADLDGDGCSTRNEILARDLARPTFRENTNDCVVQTGVLAEPYLGETVDFVRGAGTSELVQIDHVVALANAWRSGAWQWDDQKRLEFANDPLNLLAVDGQTNYDKGSQSADQWLPPNSGFHCEYAARQVAVKSRWELSVTSDEQKALRGILADCQAVTLTW